MRTSFFERHKVSIIGTFLVHAVALLVFNWVTLRPVEQEPTLTVTVEPPPEIPEEERIEQPPDPSQSVPDLRTPTDAGRNTARNEAAPRMLRSAEYNALERNLNADRKQEIEEQIASELRQVEQEVLAEQRAAGYGYTQEQAEALISSMQQTELQEVTPQEARSEGAYQGKTNITYRLADRYDTYIYVPVYLCEFGGEVTVNIAVNRQGEVVSSRIDREATPTRDACLHEAALRAAARCRFDVHADAPVLQKGSMTFRFIAQ